MAFVTTDVTARQKSVPIAGAQVRLWRANRFTAGQPKPGDAYPAGAPDYGPFATGGSGKATLANIDEGNYYVSVDYPDGTRGWSPFDPSRPATNLTTAGIANGCGIPTRLGDLSTCRLVVDYGVQLKHGLLVTGPASVGPLFAGSADVLDAFRFAKAPTAGYYLQCDALGQASWAPAAADLSSAVILAPTTSARNAMQGTTDAVIPLSVRQHSGTQSGHLQDWATSSGTAISYVDAAGKLYANAFQALGASAAGQILTATDTAGNATWAANTASPGPSSVIGAEVQRVANQSIANSTNTTVSFDTELRDDNNFWALTPNPTRITIPLAGWYAVGFDVKWALNATGQRNAWLALNGSARAFTDVAQSTASTDAFQGFGRPIYCQAGDYLELTLWQNSGGALTVTAALSIIGLAGVSASGGPPSAVVTHSANQTCGNNAFAYLNFDTDTLNNANMHFTTTSSISGTVAVTNGSATLTGTGSSFLTQLQIGQCLAVPNGLSGPATLYAVVTAIASTTSATLSIAATNTTSGQTATHVNGALVAVQTGLYEVGAVINWAFNTTANTPRLTQIDRWAAGGSGAAVTVLYDAYGTSTIPYSLGRTSVRQIALNQWDFLRVAALQGSGGNLDVVAAASYSPLFWLTLMPGNVDPSASVAITPGNSTRNIVQANGNYVPLSVKNSPGGTSHLLDFQDSGGSFIGFFDSAARANLPGLTLPTGATTLGVLTGDSFGAASWKKLRTGAYVSRSTAQSIANNTFYVAASFDTVTRDDGGFWSAGQPTRLTAPEDDWYFLGAQCHFAANNTNGRFGGIAINGTIISLDSRCVATGHNDPRPVPNLCYYMTAGQYAEFFIAQNSGGALNVDEVKFWIMRK